MSEFECRCGELMTATPYGRVCFKCGSHTPVRMDGRSNRELEREERYYENRSREQIIREDEEADDDD